MPFVEQTKQSKYLVNNTFTVDVTLKNNGEKYIHLKTDFHDDKIDASMNNSEEVTLFIESMNAKISDYKMLIELIQEVNIFKGN